MQLQSRPNKVTCWAKSTESKVTTFLDDYLINYPVKTVRESTRNLLNSLFKKGTSTQKQNMLNLIKERINKISTMGNSSDEFLTLIFYVFQGQVQNKQIEKKQVFSKILEKGQEILKHAVSSEKYDFYSYLSNTIEFSAPFQPYLVETSGCLKCYGKTQFVFEQKDCKQIIRQIRAHISQIQLIFNRTYAIKDLKINLGKKKFAYKTVSICYIDQKGEKKQLGGKYTLQDTLPALEFNGSALIFDFEFQKSKRHITCHLCGNQNSPDEYCFICSVCFQKYVDIQGNFKVIGADPDNLSVELCTKYNQLDSRKGKLEQMYEDIKNNRKTQFPSFSLIKEMETIYGQIMKNFQLFKKDDKVKVPLQLQQCKDCFSCNINQIEFIIDFFKLNFQFSEQGGQQAIKSFSTQQIGSLIERFVEISSMNKLNRLQKKINYILANLILFKNSSNIDYLDELKKINSSSIAAQILFEIVRIVKQKQNRLKQNEKLDFDWNQLGSFFNSTNYRNQWTEQQKIKLFSAYFLKSEMNDVLGMSVNSVQKQILNDLNRLDAKDYKKLQNLINFSIDVILKRPITTYTKLFLSLLPEAMVPSYNLDIVDPAYLNYIKTVAPVITDQLIYSNIVFSPNPIIKLNLFSTLPNLISYLSLEQSMKLITSLVKYKQLWNLDLKQTLKKFQEQLNKQETQKKLILSLQGYNISKQNIYLNKIYQILVPQRMNFIIRMEVPQADMQKQERSREGGPIQYIFLPVREVKSENLNGDTMRALHEWVTQQLKKMNQDLPFDLIVDKYIIDNLDLPIEVVYKKIAQKQVKKKIGNQQYDFIRVIYRMQGFFGDANQSASSNPRDQNLQACLNYSSYLLTKIPAIQKTGLDVIMSILAGIRRSESKQNSKKIFKILQIIAMNPAIIKKIIQWQYADLIINSTIKFFSLQEGSIKFSEVLLEICSKIIKEANQEMVNLRKKSYTEGFGLRKQSDLMMDLQGNIEEIQSQSQKTVKYLLEKVKQCQQKGRKDLSQKMITLIPFCSKDQIGTSKYLFEYFELNNIQVLDLKSNKKLNWFLQFIQILSQSYTSFKIFCRQNNFTDQVISNTLTHLDQFKNLEEKKTIKNLEILQLSLSVIKGLIRGDQTLQKNLFENKLVQQLYKISKLSESQLQKKGIKVGKVLTISFEIIKYFKEGHIVHPQISDFIKGQEADKIKKNQEKKKSKLFAMKQKNNIIAQKYEQELMINEGDDGFVCSSCRQGYSKRQEVLGIYIYSFKQETFAIEGWWKENKRQPGLTSVSYFTPIHFECHIKAFQSDQKILKSQWQGALIRNSDVKCNGWIAIKGPTTTDEEYDRVNKKYFDKNSKINGYWVVLNDLNGLLQKFSAEYNFSQQTKGSSSDHNSKLILVLMASTCHYMKKVGEDLKLLEQGVKYIEEHMTKRGHLLNLFFCVSIFTNTYNMYQQKKAKYLKLIEHLELTDFKEKKKFYIYLALINEIYCLIHVTLKDQQLMHEYLDKFIPENFGTLVTALDKISQKYRNIFIKWQNQAQINEYFSVAN